MKTSHLNFKLVLLPPEFSLQEIPPRGGIISTWKAFDEAKTRSIIAMKTTNDVDKVFDDEATDTTRSNFSKALPF